MKLMVLDGNSIVNRAYYGVGKARLLTTRQGLHTNAIYGFVTMLQKLLDQEKPDAVCAAFDRREPTFRHKADAAYKANRKGMPEELAEQMLPLKQVLWLLLLRPLLATSLTYRSVTYQMLLVLPVRLEASSARSVTQVCSTKAPIFLVRSRTAA